ncbi:MAG: phosphatase PAP2 family protein [bacterium]|nr:phosphatase PAP2 family protein [bacterium]
MIELEIVQNINQLGHGTFIDSLTVFISKTWFVIALWLFCCILAMLLDKKKGEYVFLTVLFAIIIHFAISEGIFKHLLPAISDSFFRTRPWLTPESSIIPLGKHYLDSSFPSSHMSSTLAALTALTYYYRKAIPLAIIIALIMAFARMHNGMHFPSDVLAGIILGIIYGLLAIKIVNKYIVRKTT